MKKYLYIIIVLLITIFSFSIRINADGEIKLIEEPIVAEINSSSFSDYDLAYMASFSGNVDGNKKGMYDLFYEDDNQNRYKRNLIVLDRDELKRGLAYTYDYDSIDKTKNIGLDGDICINGKSIYKYINERDSLNKPYAHVYYQDDYEEHVMLFENIYIKKIINIEGLAYALYEYVDSSNYIKIGVMILDKNCMQIRDNIYPTNKEERAIDLIYLDNKLYVIFNTTSNTGICTRVHSFLSGAIMEINKISLKLEKINFIANDNDSYIIKAQSYNNKLYLECHFSGDNGTYYNTYNKSYNGKMIIEYNQKSSYVLSSIASAYDNYELIFAGNAYYLCEKLKDKILIDISYIDIDYPNKSYTYPYKISDTCESINYASIGSKLIIIENDDNLITKISKLEDKSITNYVYYNHNYKINDIKYFNNEIYLLSYQDNVLISKLSIYNYEFIDSTKDKIKYEDIKIYKNYKEVDINQNRNFDNLNFGIYNKKSIKEKDNLKIIYYSKVEVPLTINVSDERVYDIGSRITFNAKAYLNNVEIESGYIVENIGKYQLDIYSENNEKRTISFYIEDMCEKEHSDEDYKKASANLNAQYVKYEEAKQYFSPNNYDVKLYENKDNVYLILSFILIISFICSIALIIHTKKRKKN